MPSGTDSSRPAPWAPSRWSPAPGRPLPAFACGRKWKSSRVCTFGSTTNVTSPPFPPLPAVRAAERHELLPVDRRAAVPAVTRLQVQDGPVDEAGHDDPPDCEFLTLGGERSGPGGAATTGPGNGKGRNGSARRNRPCQNARAGPGAGRRTPLGSDLDGDDRHGLATPLAAELDRRRGPARTGCRPCPGRPRHRGGTSYRAAGSGSRRPSRSGRRTASRPGAARSNHARCANSTRPSCVP